MNPTNILLMEDDHTIAEDIKAKLNAEGYAVAAGSPEIFNRGDLFPGNIECMISARP